MIEIPIFIPNLCNDIVYLKYLVRHPSSYGKLFIQLLKDFAVQLNRYLLFINYSETSE